MLGLFFISSRCGVFYLPVAFIVVVLGFVSCAARLARLRTVLVRRTLPVSFRSCPAREFIVQPSLRTPFRRSNARASSCLLYLFCSISSRVSSAQSSLTSVAPPYIHSVIEFSSVHLSYLRCVMVIG